MGNASATILSWITTEVDQALSLVHEQIARYSADPENTGALGSCQEHLHQVSGALRMVGLAGATRFSETIESGLAGVNTARPGAAASMVATLDRAVLALKEFVDGLERGQANVPLRLYPMYRELCELQGVQSASEKDLFYPDLALQAPAHPGARAMRAEELKPYLQAQRALFQRGLLALLRGTGGPGEMRQAIEALHQVAAQLPEPRALWWAALALVEALGEGADADWTARAKALCNKIDFQMRDLAGGATSVSETLLRDVLYAIARCRPTAPRVREVKQLYLLDSLFPDPQAADVVQLDMDWLQPALADVRSRLEALKGMWLQYVSGEAKSAVRFREQVASFKSKAGELGNPHLVRLLDAIAVVATRLRGACRR
jgi:chemosensory pili system protein ChpA (sensor histidine kinase/response regulator)